MSSGEREILGVRFQGAQLIPEHRRYPCRVLFERQELLRRHVGNVGQFFIQLLAEPRRHVAADEGERKELADCVIDVALYGREFAHIPKTVAELTFVLSLPTVLHSVEHRFNAFFPCASDRIELGKRNAGRVRLKTGRVAGSVLDGFTISDFDLGEASHAIGHRSGTEHRSNEVWATCGGWRRRERELEHGSRSRYSPTELRLAVQRSHTERDHSEPHHRSNDGSHHELLRLPRTRAKQARIGSHRFSSSSRGRCGRYGNTRTTITRSRSGLLRSIQRSRSRITSFSLRNFTRNSTCSRCRFSIISRGCSGRSSGANTTGQPIRSQTAEQM